MDYFRILKIALVVFVILLLRQWVPELFQNMSKVLPSSGQTSQYNLFAWIMIFIAGAGLIRLLSRF